MVRAAQAAIDLAALRLNLTRVKQAAPGARVMAVVKADAYGHGIVPVARALGEADALGVACLEEAMTLRGGGIRTPIVLLEGALDAEELAAAAEVTAYATAKAEPNLTYKKHVELTDGRVKGENLAFNEKTDFIDHCFHRINCASREN